MEQNTVQIWLPYPSFEESLRVLDSVTLSEQRLSFLAVMDVIHETNKCIAGRAPDELVNMWRGHEPQMLEYGIMTCEALLERGFPLAADVKEIMEWHLECATDGEFVLTKPEWFGDPRLHDAHKAELVRKMPDMYRRFFDVSPHTPIYWPQA